MAQKTKRLYVQTNGKAALFIDGKRHGFGTNTHTVDVDLKHTLTKWLLEEGGVEVIQDVDYRALVNGDLRVDDEAELERRIAKIEKANELRAEAEIAQGKAQAIDNALTKRSS